MKTNVALRKESVDRNALWMALNRLLRRSLSARRAWIEMTYVTRLPRAQVVALRKESVDRNQAADMSAKRETRSLSARRAWIEIPDVSSKIWYCGSRSPQGERG